VNCIYRLVWSERLKAFQPAAETARRRGKRSGGKSLLGAVVVGSLSASAFGGGVGAALAPITLPTAPQVTAGQASVTGKGGQLQVTESTPTAAINWGSFNIGSSAGVTFVQPTSSSVILNRVLSGDPSQIYGSLTANGVVFLINPQGVVVGRGAEVNVGGLVASTLNLSDKDLLAGNWAFTASPAAGAISNAGNIHVSPGGFAALLGSKVENTGSISAKLGSVALASGEQLTLDFDESGLLKVAVKPAALDALVSNAGAIVADGGRIILTAKSASDVLGTVVNNSGLLQAQSLGVRDGQVWLLAADPLADTGGNGAAANGNQVQGAAGAVVSSGRIDVSGNGHGAGEVTLAGATVDVAGSILAGDSGAGAGRVLINSTQNTTLEAGSVIDVSSAAAAGKLVAWSDGSTQAAGSIDGRGSGPDGVGATVEISSAHAIGFDANVELVAATAARAGTLILDPATLTIAPGSGSAADTVYQSALHTQSGNVVLSATGQITVDALTNNVLDLANATALRITSQSSGGIAFLNGLSGAPSGITTHDAPVTLNAAGSGSLDNLGTITTHGGDISLSGVYVHLAGGLDATNGSGPAGNVALSVFGGGILSSSASPIAGSAVLLDATYGYIGSASAAVPTATTDLTIKTGGNAFVANAGALDTLALSSNHLEGTPVAIGVTASNLNLTGADGIGDATMYSNAVRFTQFSAANPSNSLAGPTTVAITEDGNLAAGNINLPQSAVSLTSNQGYILGGNAQPVIASTLTLASPSGIGGTDYNGINAETDQGNAGNTLLTQAGVITANVLDPSGNITGIVNLSQIGDLIGSVQANRVLLQASGGIGSATQAFALNTGWYGEVYNAAAGSDLNLSAQFSGTLNLDNVQAGGNLALQVTTPNGWNVYVGQATAGADLTLTGTQFGSLRVASAASTGGSIAITNDNTLEVDVATLNGTDAANRSITLTSNYSDLAYGLLSTDGPTGSAAASAPLGSISINAMRASIYDLAAWEDPPPSVLRAGNATLNALYSINLYNTGVDTYTNLTLNAGVPGSNSGSIDAYLSGLDSVNDVNGNSAHSIHLGSATSHNGNLTINNNNGDLDIGTVRSYHDYGGDSSSGNIYLTASGSVLADGSVGGGRISAEDLGGYGGYLSLNAGGSLGLRGTGADGPTGAVYLPRRQFIRSVHRWRSVRQ
jgi:filamentous hemagglutinin family protein